jgi:hypothetical protein
VPVGHAPDQVRRVGAGHPGRRDEQGAYRGSAPDRRRVGSRAEPGLGHPDHRDAELGVRMCAQAGSAAGIQIGVTIDHQQAQPAQILQDRAQRREFAQVELARPVERYPGYYRGSLGQHVHEGGIGGQGGCRPGARATIPGTMASPLPGHAAAAQAGARDRRAERPAPGGSADLPW